MPASASPRPRARRGSPCGSSPPARARATRRSTLPAQAAAVEDRLQQRGADADRRGRSRSWKLSKRWSRARPSRSARCWAAARRAPRRRWRWRRRAAPRRWRGPAGARAASDGSPGAIARDTQVADAGGLHVEAFRRPAHQDRQRGQRLALLQLERRERRLLREHRRLLAREVERRGRAVAARDVHHLEHLLGDREVLARDRQAPAQRQHLEVAAGDAGDEREPGGLPIEAAAAADDSAERTPARFFPTDRARSSRSARRCRRCRRPSPWRRWRRPRSRWWSPWWWCDGRRRPRPRSAPETARHPRSAPAPRPGGRARRRSRGRGCRPAPQRSAIAVPPSRTLATSRRRAPRHPRAPARSTSPASGTSG